MDILGVLPRAARRTEERPTQCSAECVVFLLPISSHKKSLVCFVYSTGS